MRNSRGLLSLAAGVAVLIAAAAVAWVFLPRPLPDPAECDRDGLLRWIVCSDLREQPAGTRQSLARRLDEAFREEIDWDAAADRLDRPQREQAWENVLLLSGPWFMDRVADYFALSPAERLAYLDEILDRLRQWQRVEMLCRTDGGPDAERPDEVGFLGQLLSQVEDFKADLAPEQQRQAAEFQLALQGRWLFRRLWGESAGGE